MRPTSSTKFQEYAGFDAILMQPRTYNLAAPLPLLYRYRAEAARAATEGGAERRRDSWNRRGRRSGG